MIFAGWERFFGVMGGSSIDGCSGFVFRGKMERTLRDKNKVLKQMFFCFRVPLCPLFCSLTGYHRGQREESRGPP